jgi:hypothetical protein
MYTLPIGIAGVRKVQYGLRRRLEIWSLFGRPTGEMGGAVWQEGVLRPLAETKTA